MNSILSLLVIILTTTITHSQWQQKGIDIDGEAIWDWSGAAVSMSSDGNTLAIGAYENDGTAIDAGHVRVYEWSGSWTQKGNDIDGEAASDLSGWSVSMSSDGNTLAIGSFVNDGAAINAGHVRVYEWSGSWVQKGNDIDGEAAEDWSGWSVSMSSDGNTLAIGAPGNDVLGLIAGYVRVYSWSGSAWVQKGIDIDGEAIWDRSGESVSMSSDGNTLAIGAIYNGGTGEEAGHVRVYSWSGSAWVQKGMDIDGEAALDHSGFSVSINSDGNTVAIGAPLNDGVGIQAGHVRVYEWSGSAWGQKGSDIDGEVLDHSGISVSINSDGNSVAISASGNDYPTTNVGHVRLYEWSSSAWVQKGNDIIGEATNDHSGISISTNSDGNSVAIGSPNNDGGIGSHTGHVRVYQWNSLGLLENDLDHQLLKIIDLMGRETAFKANTPLIYIYDDGSTERVFKIE
jgi:hypothetical protein